MSLFDPETPPAMVQKADIAAEAIAEARAVDEQIVMQIGQTADLVRKRGELLLKAKNSVPHGEWLETLAKKWPGLPERTARHYMRIAKSANLADLIRTVTHPENTPSSTTQSQPAATAGGSPADHETRATEADDDDFEEGIGGEPSLSPSPSTERTQDAGAGAKDHGTHRVTETTNANKRAGSRQVSAQSSLDRKVSASLSDAADMVGAVNLAIRQAVACDARPSTNLELLAGKAAIPFADRPEATKAAAGFEDRAPHQHKRVWPVLDLIEELIRKAARGETDDPR